MTGVWAIVVAAGSGARFGAPKQFETLDGRRVLEWSVSAARRVSDGVVLVVPPGREAVDPAGADAVVTGGASRSDSVRAGLSVVPEEAEVIVVHDAARPLAAATLFDQAIAAVRRGAAAAVPGVAVSDTVKRVEGGRVVETLDRSGLVQVQTPQAFAAEALRRAHREAGDATDDAALVEAQGGTVVVFPGDPANVKITHPHDLAVASALLSGRCR